MNLIIRHIVIVACFLIILAGKTGTDEIYLVPTADQAATPAFSVWVECILRGPYEGMATAYVSYQYDGAFAVTPEDSRLFGDTATGDTIILNYPIEPGQHDQALIVNVGANKVVTLKIILFSKLHVVAIWDDPEVKDCSWATPEPTLEATPNI